MAEVVKVGILEVVIVEEVKVVIEDETDELNIFLFMNFKFKQKYMPYL
jgi:hypothetical protein